MNLTSRLEALSALGEHLLRGEDELLRAFMHRTHFNNLWFTMENQERALQAIAQHFLDLEKLEAWVAAYPALSDAPTGKTVGMVMAGNIPLVGFHDLLCVFVAGHKSVIKLSDKDRFLLPYLLQLLEKFAPESAAFFEITERLSGFDAVIATGSNNSSRYFEAYFGKYPHIIRKNRNAVAVLDGSEDREQLRLLGKDIFRYFGLGCRNVSKVYLPRGYDFNPLMETLHEFRDIVLHDKYKNNFDYNMALTILNRTPLLNNGCIILTEDAKIPSRIACVHYEYFDALEAVEEDLRLHAEEIQCVVARPGLLSCPHLDFGKTQEPSLSDYPDGVDVMAFLSRPPN